MPKHPGYPPARIRSLLERAGAEVLADRLTRGRVVALPVSDVLRRANALLLEEDPEAQFVITTGAVGYTFGGKEGLQEAILAAVLGPQFGGADVLAASDEMPAEDALAAIAVADHLNQTRTNLALMQTWLLAVAEAGGRGSDGAAPASTTLTAQVYGSFDVELIPRYQDIAARSGRRLRPGVTWADVGAALTAISEGVALRHLGDPSSRERTLDWARNFQAILWDGLTEPTPVPPGNKRRASSALHAAPEVTGGAR